jgi:antitoxin HicB
MLDWHIRNGKDIPAARKRGRRYRMIDLPAIIALKIELYNAFRASGVTKTEFAAKLGIPKGNVDRYFSFGNHTRLDQLEAAFAALGRRVEVSVSKAA